MKKTTILSISVILGLLSLLTVACGSSSGKIEVPKGPMPEGGNFDGVYHSAAYGRMEFTVSGNDVSGLYEGERSRGRIQGIIEGDLMSFEWEQWNQDLQGKSRSKKGRGYFKYTIETEGEEPNVKQVHWIKGQWGYNENNSGNTWEAVKLTKKSKKYLKPVETDGPRESMGDDYESASGFEDVGASESNDGAANDSIQRSNPTTDNAGKNMDDLF